MSEETLVAAPPEVATQAPAKEPTLSVAKTTVVKKATPKPTPKAAAPKVATPKPAPKGLKAVPAAKGRPVGVKNSAPKAPTPAKLPANLKEVQSRFRPASEFVKLISEPTRLGMLVLLGEENLNVGELCVAMGAKSQPAISHHLAIMKMARIVGCDRDGKNNIYSITERGQRLLKLFEMFEEDEKSL